MYLPLSFWPLLLEEWPELPLRRHKTALRLIGGLRSVNVMSVEWIHAGERLRGVFQLAEPLEGWVERLGEKGLRIRFAGGRLSDFDWERLPAGLPVDSLYAADEEAGARLDLYLQRAPGELRSSSEPSARRWAFTAELPARPGFYEPEFEGEMSEIEPESASDQRISRIILDPGHGGEDPGAISGDHAEKDWNLRLAAWLGPALEREGFKVIWTRREDAGRSTAERAQAANAAEGDLYLTLHFTRRGAQGPQGLEIILQEAETGAQGSAGLEAWGAVSARHDETSLDLASRLQQTLSARSDWPQLGIRREATATLEGMDMPALMLELGNLDSAAERAAWEDEPTREQRLRALARALAGRASGEERKRHWWERAGSGERR